MTAAPGVRAFSAERITSSCGGWQPVQRCPAALFGCCTCVFAWQLSQETAAARGWWGR